MTRLHQLRQLRDRIDAEIAAEEAKTARIRRTTGRLPTLVADRPLLLVSTVADEYGVPTSALSSGSRSSKLSDARALVAWLADHNGIKRRDTADMLGMANTSSITLWLRRVNERPHLLAAAHRLADRLDGEGGGMKVPTIGTVIPAREDRAWVTTQELTAEAGVTYRQADYWCRTGLLAPIDDATPGTGHVRRFAEGQIEKANLLAELLEAGFSLQICRQIIDDLLADQHVDVGPFTLTIRSSKTGVTAA